MKGNPTALPLVALVGPTAIGKTALALDIAEQFQAEIVGVDSMQVYCHMDIGTAKPTPAERARIRHHLVDFVDPADHYTAGRYVTDAGQAIEEIRSRGHLPFLVGGTGLYLRSLLTGLFGLQPSLPLGSDQAQEEVRSQLKARLDKEGRAQLFAELKQCDPVSAARIHPNDTQRLLRGLEIFLLTSIPWSKHLAQQQEQEAGSTGKGWVLKLGLTCDRERLYARINQRVHLMLEQGLVQEVENLLNMGYDKDLKSMQSIGYRHVIEYLEGNWDYGKMARLLARDTRRYAKRQYTWFQRDAGINWFEPGQQEMILDQVGQFLKR